MRHAIIVALAVFAAGAAGASPASPGEDAPLSVAAQRTLETFQQALAVGAQDENVTEGEALRSVLDALDAWDASTKDVDLDAQIEGLLESIDINPIVAEALAEAQQDLADEVAATAVEQAVLDGLAAAVADVRANLCDLNPGFQAIVRSIDFAALSGQVVAEIRVDLGQQLANAESQTH